MGMVIELRDPGLKFWMIDGNEADRIATLLACS
jgi:hypothetical protein